MNAIKFMLLLGCAASVAACGSGSGSGAADAGSAGVVTVTTEALGAALFADRNLSSSGTQACADCHASVAAFSDPDHGRPVSQGAVAGRFGTRNAPTAMYASFVPALHQETAPGGGLRWVGGLFLDGRADDLETQAQAPLFNPQEMNLADAADLHAHLAASPARTTYEAVYGAGSLADGVDENLVLTRVAAAIAAFERGSSLRPFTSKFDAVLAGRATFTAQEALGRDVFTRPDKGGCARCHAITPGPSGSPPLFSNFAYENLGVPHNPDTTFYAAGSVDAGLESTLLARGVDATAAAAARGRFRVPTLRNVALTPPYMHNGVFTDLHTVVDFYNTRDSDPVRWAAIGAPEVPETENHTIGNLGLSAQEVDAVVAFLGTLSDGYVAP